MIYQMTTLPNGVRVATAEMPHMASVSVGLWAAVGSRHEAARINGAAHFLEHLLFKGTRRRSARQISGEVEALGGYLEAFTAEDHTCYYAKAEAEHLEGLGDVLGDIYIHSRLPAAEVERERGVIREEILMYRDQPAQVAEEFLAETLWPGHPLGRPLAGTLESVAAYAPRRIARLLARRLSRALDGVGRRWPRTHEDGARPRGETAARLAERPCSAFQPLDRPRHWWKIALALRPGGGDQQARQRADAARDGFPCSWPPRP